MIHRRKPAVRARTKMAATAERIMAGARTIRPIPRENNPGCPEILEMIHSIAA